MPKSVRGFRGEKVVVRGVLVGLLVTVLLLAFEGASARFVATAPDVVDLEPNDFGAFGFTISAPSSWTPSETAYRAELRAPERIGRRATRGMHALLTSISIAQVPRHIALQRDSRPDDYRSIGLVKDRVDGAATVVNVFIADDLRFEQWWIDRGKSVLRIEFWSRPSDDDAPALNERMIRSLELR